MIYLDASVVVPIVILESASSRLDAWLATGPEVCMSQWTISEVSSALSHHLRTGRLKPEGREAAERALDHWASVNRIIEIDDADIIASRALLKFDTSLRTPDAFHLSIVARLGCGLATYDVRLAASARAVGVNVVAP